MNRVDTKIPFAFISVGFRSKSLVTLQNVHFLTYDDVTSIASNLFLYNPQLKRE